MTQLPKRIDDELHYWIQELQPEEWFKRDDGVDTKIRKRFGA